jgi:hypothetical protein
MSTGRIYASIAAIIADLAETGIAKSRTNAAAQYAYRGIDEVCNRLAPLLAQHRVCILPRVLERASEERSGEMSGLLIRVTLRVAFDLVSARDGSSHTVETYGEALDGGDKATAKAMSGAYKQAMLQAFCIPVQGADDPDAETHRISSRSPEVADPDHGWHQWANDIEQMIRVCSTPEALDRVQTTYRTLLQAASRRQPDVYAKIGNTMRDRRNEVGSAAPRPSHVKTRGSAAQAAEGEHA